MTSCDSNVLWMSFRLRADFNPPLTTPSWTDVRQLQHIEVVEVYAAGESADFGGGQHACHSTAICDKSSRLNEGVDMAILPPRIHQGFFTVEALMSGMVIRATCRLH